MNTQATIPALASFAHVAARGEDRSSQNARVKVEAAGFDFFYGKFQALKSINLHAPEHRVTALIGPSGCGKSTLLRAINRMHDRTPGARGVGTLLLDGTAIYGPETDPVSLRRRVGMVFQRPNPFQKTIFDNVAYGLRLNGIRNHSELTGQVEQALKKAALWNEVKDKLNTSGLALSGGQQQRLCIARAIATTPEVLLMDEPCSALDPIATGKIEELIYNLRDSFTIIIVTHNMQQAARVSDITAFLLMDSDTRAGRVVEVGPTSMLFTNPRDKRTEDYISGKFG